MKRLLLASTMLILASPAHAISITYNVSGTFFPIIENCPGCTPLNLSGTVTINQTANNITISAVDFIATGLSDFVTINERFTFSNNIANLIFADGPFGEITIGIKPALSSNVFSAIIYDGAITDLKETIEYYSLGTTGYLHTPDGLIERAADPIVSSFAFNAPVATPGPILGTGLPGLILMFATWLGFRKGKQNG